MSSSGNVNLLNAVIKLYMTVVMSILRLVVFAFKLIPQFLSKALTILMKVGVIYKLLIDPVLRSLGSLIKNAYYALNDRNSRKEGHEQGEKK